MLKGKGKLLACVLVISMVSVLFAGCGGGAADNKEQKGSSVPQDIKPQYTMRVSTNHPVEHPTTAALNKFAEELKSKSGGKIELKVYTGAQLGEETEVIEQARQGAIDFVRVSAGNMSNFAPSMDIFSVPFLFKDAKSYWTILNGEIGTQIMSDLEAKNMKGIVFYDGGARSFYNRIKPIKTPEDMKGMKIRVMPSKAMLATIQALGATATSTSFSEVYSALQTGVIDGAENSVISLQTMNHFEVAKYFSLSEHMRIPDMLVMSLDKWNSMPKDLQQVIVDAAKVSQEFQLKAWADSEGKALDFVKAKGEQVNDVDKAAFQAAVQPLVESLKPAFKGLIEKIQAVK